MTVRRIHTENGSRIEPPFDESWPPQRRLEWWAAVTALDTGLNVEIRPRARHDTYSVIAGNTSTSPLQYRDAWTYLTGFSAGARSKPSADIEEVSG